MFRFRDSDALGLEDWHTQRPRLDKDFKLRRINMPREEGLVVDCAEAWRCLADCAADLAGNHSERLIRASDLILGLLYYLNFWVYTNILLQSSILSSSQDMRHFG